MQSAVNRASEQQSRTAEVLAYGSDRSNFINARYLTDAALTEIRAWYDDPIPRPIGLEDFLVPQVARDMGEVLRTLPSWSRYAGIYQGRTGKEERFDDDIPDDAQPTASHQIVRDIPALLEGRTLSAEHRAVLERFFAFSLISEAFQGWLIAATGLKLRRVANIELACYQNSDGIGEHQDLVPGRVLALNFYLDESYDPAQGGHLGLRNAAGEVHHVVPRFNTLSVIPIREDCWHWVEPFRTSGTGRFTVAMGQHLAS
ncbi:2OG-Fe(II) oxygenase [Dactylosporangium sp. NPDC005555]|uniref:2OG-Fe(II) oxygenase n=1 Tax=Dactylosporangium sp. NPDC005555 TaxID=3154889 RepID=UPI0033B76E68